MVSLGWDPEYWPTLALATPLFSKAPNDTDRSMSFR